MRKTESAQVRSSLTGYAGRWCGLLMSVMLMLILTLAGCSFGEKMSDIDKAKLALDRGDYDTVIESMTRLLETEPDSLEAWDLVAESYIQTERFEEADAWLEQYLEMIDERMVDPRFDYLAAVDSVGDFARDIRRNDEEVGDWYSELIPKPVPVEGIGDRLEVGETLTFDVPDDSVLLYTMDYSSPISGGLEYDEGILLDEAGFIYLQLVVRNRYGEYSKGSEAFIDVYDPELVYDGGSDMNGDIGDDGDDPELVYDGGSDMNGDISDDGDEPETEDGLSEDIGDSDKTLDLVLPEVDLVPGEYTDVQEAKIINYSTDHPDLTIVYTTDGSDPREFGAGIRYYYEGIPMVAGSYELSIVAYDIEKQEYSDVAQYEFYIDHPEKIKLGFYDMPQATVDNYKAMFDRLGDYELYIEPVVYEDLNNINFSNLPDALITYGTYAKDLAEYNIVADIDSHFKPDDYDYIGNAAEIGRYNGIRFMLPLTVRQEYMVYGDYEGAGRMSWDYLKEEPTWAEERFIFPADSPEAFLGVYYGLGGKVLEFGGTGPELDRDTVIQALEMIQAIVTEGLSNEIHSMADVEEAISWYGSDYFLAGEALEKSADGVFYAQAGAMPLIDGGNAMYYNVATGLYVSNLSIAMEPTLVDKMQKFYDFFLSDTYSVPSISTSLGAIPAERNLARELEFYYHIPMDEYMAAIDNGISKIRTYGLQGFYSDLSEPMADFATGAGVEATADRIMEAAGR